MANRNRNAVPPRKAHRRNRPRPAATRAPAPAGIPAPDICGQGHCPPVPPVVADTLSQRLALLCGEQWADESAARTSLGLPLRCASSSSTDAWIAAGFCRRSSRRYPANPRRASGGRDPAAPSPARPRRRTAGGRPPPANSRRAVPSARWLNWKAPRGLRTVSGRPGPTLVTTGTCSGMTPWNARAACRLT